MKKRNFGNLAKQGSAGAANSGTLMDSAQKDRVVYFDPVTEIVYDPKLNVRREPVNDDIAGLIDLRLTMDREGQMAPIRVYPLTPELLKKYGKKPTDKLYGIAIGHRRYLASLLTTDDHPSIGTHPRKVTAIIDTSWLSKTESEKVLYMLNENNKRKGLNYVEYGESIRRFQIARSTEENRHVSQRELMEVFNESAKTIGYLVQAAEFEQITKDACISRLLTDLDSLVTIDALAKKHPDFAKAIFKSLEDPEAPRTRSLIREAKAFIEADPEYVVDEKTWVWPDSIKKEPELRSATTEAAQGNTDGALGGEGSFGSIPPANNAAGASHSNEDHPGGSVSGGETNTGDSDGKELLEKDPGTAGPSPVQEQGSESTTAGRVVAPEAGSPKAPAPSDSHKDSSLPVVMVSFKMNEEAPLSFNGELLVSEVAKQPNMGVVGYLEEGKEKRIQVPLQLITLLSISHDI